VLFRSTNERLDEAVDRLDQTIGRIDQTNGRIDQTNGRVDQVVDRLDRLERRVTEGFIETNTKLADLSGRVEASAAALGERLENVFKGQLGQDVRDL
jgi:hypothetical protein